MDWEAWLRSASKPPSETEDTKRQRTQDEIRQALSASSALKGKNYEVYAKGSYANNTNVRLNYDVDIAVEYRGFFYSDLCFELEGEPKESLGIFPSTDPYTPDEFKSDIRAALVKAFGETSVTDGRIAFRIREKKTTLPADIVPCYEYRRYDRLLGNGSPFYHVGSRIFPATGWAINNFPEQQLSNGREKNVRTGSRYKYTVRALKRLQTYLMDRDLIQKELASYLIECLVYNIVDTRFGGPAYLADMREVLAAIFNATLSTGDYTEWEEVNGLKYLFRGSSDSMRQEAHALADTAWNELGLT
jgi:hypothetical protein